MNFENLNVIVVSEYYIPIRVIYEKRNDDNRHKPADKQVRNELLVGGFVAKHLEQKMLVVYKNFRGFID